MVSNNLFNYLIVIVLTIISGFFDSKGFIHASKIWQSNHLVVDEVFKSAGGFAIGIVFYWIVIKYLNLLGYVSAEIQTIVWFAVTIIGVAIVSGDFIQWRAIDKLVSVVVFLGISWLLINTE